MAASQADAVDKKALDTAVGVRRDEANGIAPADVAAVVHKVVDSRRPLRWVSLGESGERIGIIAKRLDPIPCLSRPPPRAVWV